MKGILLGIGLLLCFRGVFAQPDVERLLASPGLEHAIVGISVKSVKDGRNILQTGSQLSLQPASVCKILSTALALKEKGADYHYFTPVWLTGEIAGGTLNGNILIEAQGDPTLDSRYFREHSFLDRLLKTLREKGIKRIEGEIRIEGEGKLYLPGSWLWEDISNYYGAAYRKFNYRDNAYSVSFRTGNPGEKTLLLAVEPEQPGVEFINEVKAAEGNKDDAWIYGGPYSKEMHILGTLPQNRKLYQIKGAMHHPAACFRHELEKKLSAEGIVVEKRKITDSRRTLLFTSVSPSLKEIVRQTNKKSINLFAEALGHLVDSVNYPERCRELLEEIGIRPSGIVLKDASGLSVFNALPATVFTDVLVWAYDTLGWDFVASLPLAGTDSGLNAYSTSFPELKNKLRAKTGSMSGVRALSGYLTTREGEVLAFTILVNHYEGTAARLQRNIGKFLASFL